jgi:hypothetical protein
MENEKTITLAVTLSIFQSVPRWRWSLALRLQGQSWRCWHNDAVDKVATENAHERWTSTLQRLEGLPQTLALP